MTTLGLPYSVTFGIYLLAFLWLLVAPWYWLQQMIKGAT